jgi:Flp pilus assembly protein TadG
MMARQFEKESVRRHFGSRLKDFWRDSKGASFVEFAIIAMPLFLLIFGIIELGLVFWATYELENATADAARLVKTGQAQGMDASALKNQICSEVVILSNCTSQVQLSIQAFTAFGAMQAPNPLDKNGKLITTLNGDPSQIGPAQDVLMISYYEWPLVIPLVSAALSNMGDGNFLIQSAAVFRSEPF